jgi:hypothetical protein
MVISSSPHEHANAKHFLQIRNVHAIDFQDTGGGKNEFAMQRS